MIAHNSPCASTVMTALAMGQFIEIDLLLCFSACLLDDLLALDFVLVGFHGFIINLEVTEWNASSVQEVYARCNLFVKLLELLLKRKEKPVRDPYQLTKP